MSAPGRSPTEQRRNEAMARSGVGLTELLRGGAAQMAVNELVNKIIEVSKAKWCEP